LVEKRVGKMEAPKRIIRRTPQSSKSVARSSSFGLKSGGCDSASRRSWWQRFCF
jgi:hypothetical protein